MPGFLLSGPPRISVHVAGGGIKGCPPAAPVEEFPILRGLGKPIGNGIEHRRIDNQATMAPVHLNIVGEFSFRLPTDLPGRNAVALAEYRGRGHRRWQARSFEALDQFGGVDPLPCHELKQMPGIGGTGIPRKRAAQGNHLAHAVRVVARGFPRHNTAQAPADQTQLFTGLLTDAVDAPG